MKRYTAEFIGTFALVFCGTGAIIIDQQTGGSVSHVGISATFGLIIMAMIYSFGEISGAHFNPAVTIAFAFAKLFPKKDVLLYIASQLAGAFLATIVLKILFPANQNLGSSLPLGSALQSFVLELIISFLLMIVILNVSQGSKETGVMAGIAIGGVILLMSLFAGPISGSSMNPARSMAPAIISGNLNSVWIYLTAPFLGMIAATTCWSWMKHK